MDNVIIYDAIDGVLNECETVVGGGVNNIQGTLANGVVKSIQRGRASGAVSYNARVQLSVNLSPVDVSKSLIIVTSAIAESSSYAAFRISDVTVSNFDEENLTICVRSIRVDGSSTDPVKVVADWQVIEFY